MARNPRSLWESYTNLPRRVRLIFGLAVGVTGIVGLVVADKLEEVFPADKKRVSTTSRPTPAADEK
ncbi:hypothetical protein Clacol_007629 [Clathrus columnatus]|uniref:Uncharacterized protein n=1 Tax=Clathrus columnatus TaxID=1419009 RepID=A0AAV5AI70_9AGAM|nr:hypothetical protein Clacol_007629 [Clathrus columnatus]